MPTHHRSPLEFPGAGADPIWPRALASLDTAERSILSGPVARDIDAAALRAQVAEIDLEVGIGEGAVARVLALLEHATTHTIHPRYFGLFNPTPAAWGQVADLISARMNPQLAVWSHAPAAVEMERRALEFVAARLQFHAGGSFFTSGGEEANRAGVQVALVRAFPGIVESGLRAVNRQPIFYVSAESHLAWLKIAANVGLGHRAVRLVPTDADLAMDVNAVLEMIAVDRNHGLAPFMIGATAGTTSAGIVDPLMALADVAQREGLALHVDAAWAGAVAFSDRWRGVLQGIERADSVTIDAHKWLSQPVGTGMFFARSDEWLRIAYGVSTSYMPPAVEGSTNFYQLSPQWSRPFRGLRLYLTLAAAGRQAYEKQIDDDVVLGDNLRHRLETDGWEVLKPDPASGCLLHEPGTRGRYALARGCGRPSRAIRPRLDFHGSPGRATGTACVHHELSLHRGRHRDPGERPARRQLYQCLVFANVDPGAHVLFASDDWSGAGGPFRN